jgi:hypothetical protein
MSFKSLMSRRTLAPIALLVAIVLLAISPRAMLGPAFSFNRAQESKRPKSPKNIVRSESYHASNAERLGRQAKADHADLSPHTLHDLQVRIALTPSVPSSALRQLTKPDYLNLYRGSPSRAGLAPPL